MKIANDGHWSYDYVVYVGTIPVCTQDSDISTSVYNRLLFATRICAVLGDAVVLIITWRHTYRIRREANEANMKTSFLTLLLMDGTLYFSCLLSLSALQLATALVLEKEINSTFLTYTSTFISPISSVLISRFMLNLRQVSRGDNGQVNSPTLSSVPALWGVESSSQMASLRFVGNMGAPLDHGASWGSLAGTDADADVLESEEYLMHENDDGTSDEKF
ncbi:hypothetical protein WOLCODRAFT_139467 [Wolfiporia cocos MD-104 SS10]|uniref:Uncharacterized protein n=1 Tax=Wolfiporia cocos (strain MD-104) TaxID=742152 RepID=A0A2H3IYV5_WOLCO|nr:hypothetical protein WOLCODRAFT_139467 [Wolfiporia cocos MD-104 SS10]